MAIFKKASQVYGKFVDKKLLTNGIKAIITNEATSQPSNFMDKNGEPQFQDVCKCKFEGFAEEFNVNLNKPTVQALIDSFGEDSVNWMNQPLTVEVEKTRVAGKAGISLFLIPDGYKKIDNRDGFAEIVKNSFEEQLKS